MSHFLAISLAIIFTFSACNKNPAVDSTALPDNCVMMADSESPSKKVCFQNVAGRALIEGDIDIGSVEDLKNPKPQKFGQRSLGLRAGLRFRWPSAIVPYVIDTAAVAYTSEISQAIAHYHANTGIRFQVRTTEASFVTFQFIQGDSDSPCASSSLGRTGINQSINLFGALNNSSACSDPSGRIVHELGHALGLFHEQQRHDRNQYITIDPSVLSGTRGSSIQFQYLQQLFFGEDIGGYDLTSIMHYGPLQGAYEDASRVGHLAFIKPGTESLTLRQQYDALAGVGQRITLSAGDISGLAFLYSDRYIEQPEIFDSGNLPSATSISFLLHDHSSNEDGFIVEKAVFDFITGVRYEELARLPAITSSIIEISGGAPILQTINKLARGTSYQIRVRAFSNSGRNSSPSTVIAVRTLAAPPAAPTNLAGTAVAGQVVSTIRLLWGTPTGPVAGYKISKSLNVSGPWDQEVSALASPFNFTQALSSDTQYYFRIRAFNEGGDSDYSIAASAKTLPLPPLAPTVFAAVADGVNLKLTWADNSNNETGFKIERSLAAAGPWTALAIQPVANDVSAVDSALTQNTTYYYRISAINAAGASAIASTNGKTGNAKPNAPTNLILAVASTTSVKVTWLDNSPLKTGFKIERATSAAGPWTATPNIGPTLRTGTVSSLVTKTKYFFRVTTLNGTNSSDPSSVVSITTGIPSAPTSLTVIPSSSTAMALAWVDSNDNETAVAIYMKKGATGAYAKLTPSPNVGIFAYAKSDLIANTTYYFKIRATNLAGFSESVAVSATTPN